MGKSAQTGQTQVIIDALSSAVRREILWLVWDRELPAGEIARSFDLAAPTISQHLAVLRRSGLVEVKSEGTFRRYRARQEAVIGLRGLLERDDRKWIPEPAVTPLASAGRMAVVALEIDVPCDQRAAFRGFTDPAVYSRWLGVPVTLRDGHFSCTMEWGDEIRGRYEHVLEPSLIVMNWDFEANAVPVPGESQRAYLHITATADGCRLQLNQLVRSDQQAEFMEVAWGFVLGRFQEHIHEAIQPDPVGARRRRRPK
jgi:DNA-binding transcriptional ArsR family regulator